MKSSFPQGNLLLELTDRYETNEIMVLCNVFDFEAKKESYERLAGMFL